MLSLTSKSCGVYIIVFEISLAMLFYRFLKNNLYNPPWVDFFFPLCGLFFIWEWGIFLGFFFFRVSYIFLFSPLTLQSRSLHQSYVNTLSNAACSDLCC